MLSVEEGVRLLLAAVPVPRPEDVDLWEAVGRVLAEDVVAEEDLPGFDRATMDGYAVRSEDVAGAAGRHPTVLRVVDRAAAGHPAATPVTPGTAVAISTGAPLPHGADAVVRFEETRAADGRVAVLCPVHPGENVGVAGEDVRAGERVLAAGTALRAPEIGILAALGWARVPVYRRPRVDILPTGDELVGVAEAPAYGQVRDSTAYALGAAARLCGGEPRLLPRVPDRLDAIASGVAAAASGGADVVLTTGGASVGEHDLARDAFESVGAEILFWRVAMKPGMNIVAARLGETLLLGLSGNPAAALATFEVIVRPALTALSGAPRSLLRLAAILDEEVKRIPVRSRYVRVQVYAAGGTLRARPSGSQLPSVLSSLTRANAFAVIPPGLQSTPRGERVEVLLFEGAEAALMGADGLGPNLPGAGRALE